MAHRRLFLLLTTPMAWTARLAPAVAVASLLLVLDGGLRWLGLFGLPLLLLAFWRGGIGCGPRGCGLGSDRTPGSWPAP